MAVVFDVSCLRGGGKTSNWTFFYVNPNLEDLRLWNQSKSQMAAFYHKPFGWQFINSNVS